MANQTIPSIQVKDSNVGIGTTAPIGSLTVKQTLGDGGANGGITVLNDNNVLKCSLFAGGNAPREFGHFLLRNSSNQNSVVLRTTGADNFILNGNVGIGTNAPGAILHTSDASSATRVYVDNTANAAAGAGVFFRTFSGGTQVSNATVRTDNAGNFSIFTGTTGETEHMRITSGGNVLINTTTDSGFKLDVSGSNRINLGSDGGILYAQGASSNLIQLGTDAAGAYIEATGASSGRRILRMQVFNGTNDYAQFFIDGANNYIYTSSNIKFGIGTTAPTSKLDVDGSIRFNGGVEGRTFPHNSTFGSGADATTTTLDAGSTNLYRSSVILAGGTATDPNTIKLLTASTEKMRITSDGGLLVGTTSQTYNNSIYGYVASFKGAITTQSYISVSLSNQASTSQGMLFGLSSTTGDIYVLDNKPLVLYTNSAEKMRITAGGNVLINTTTDGGYKLRVNGEILADDDIRILNTFALVLNGTDNNWRIGRNTITDTGYLTGNTTQIVVSNASSGQGFQVVNSGGTALFEVEGISGYTRITISLGVGVDPSGTTGRIDASNDIVAFSTSDSRLKENITPIPFALEKVKALTGVMFDWKEETKAAHGHSGRDTGIIAQEVLAVMPTAVRTNDTGYLAVRYEKLIGLLIEANKELAERVEQLEKLIK